MHDKNEYVIATLKDYKIESKNLEQMLRDEELSSIDEL